MSGALYILFFMNKSMEVSNGNGIFDLNLPQQIMLFTSITLIPLGLILVIEFVDRKI